MNVDRYVSRRALKKNFLCQITFKPLRWLLFATLIQMVALCSTGKQAISATTVGGPIYINTHWTLAGSPYVVTSDVIIFSGTLTIDPGVKVLFNRDTGIQVVDGVLDAQGTISQTVLFSSFARMYTPYPTPLLQPGAWKSIYINTLNPNLVSRIENCVIENGGGSGAQGSVVGINGNFILKNCTVLNSGTSGIYLQGASPEINGNEITANNGNGIYCDNNSFPQISANEITYNSGAAINISPAGVANVGGNTGSGNGFDQIRIRSGIIASSCTWPRRTVSNFPYVVSGDITVKSSISSSSGTPCAILTLEPGTCLKFEPGTGLYVGSGQTGDATGFWGALSAVATVDLPIIFTLNGEMPTPGGWKGIYFSAFARDDLSRLDHCVVEYGGHTHEASLFIDGSDPSITNSTIRYSGAKGVFVDHASPIIGSNQIHDNAGDGLFSSEGASPSVYGNECSSNGESAISVCPGGVQNLWDNTGSGNGGNWVEIRGGSLTTTALWRKAAEGNLQYVVSGDVVIRSADESRNGSTWASLSLEPGVELRFQPGAGLYVGEDRSDSVDDNWGALFAQGTEALPVRFTSNAPLPGPGDWKGIVFRKWTRADATLLEHCIIEYGGSTEFDRRNLYLADSSPSIRYSVIRHSNGAGILADGHGSDGAVIQCNVIEDNAHGIYVMRNANPGISGNHFVSNREFGIYNAGTDPVTATGNWWGDINGPGYNGDDVYGNVDADPWLTSESECLSSPPTNIPPLLPGAPSPADHSVRVPVTGAGMPVPVVLSWTGGDPNLWDTVTYELYGGTEPDGLSLVAEDLPTSEFSLVGLDEGITFFWQVIAHDLAGQSTTGPVWRFTTLGPPPDLIVSDIIWHPDVDIEVGQTVTFTATVLNQGTGPVVDPFQAAFILDDSNIGIIDVENVLHAGESTILSLAWTAGAGDHWIEVDADINGSVDETAEANNSLLLSLPPVADYTPPELVETEPGQHAVVKDITGIAVTLADPNGEIADQQVIDSFSVVDPVGQPVSGTVMESNNVFTFTPDTLPLADGSYVVTLLAVDLAGNTLPVSFSFTLDNQPPAAPEITGGIGLNGPIQPRPEQNLSQADALLITGTREDYTAVWINDTRVAIIGTGEWAYEAWLYQGMNSFEIYLVDAAGNRSDSRWVDIILDSVAPKITGISPPNGTFLHTPPISVTISFIEETSALNPEKTVHSLKDGDKAEVPGTWECVDDNRVVFTSAQALTDSVYELTIQLEDDLGNRSAASTTSFTIDTVPPAAPGINAAVTPTHSPVQVLSGTKEAYSALLVNGTEVVGNTLDSIWQATVNLQSGWNSFAVSAKDRAGNIGPASDTAIFFDDIPPPAVDTLNLNEAGDGTQITLDWSGYDASAHGDVALYRIYTAAHAFSDVSGMTALGTVAAGEYVYTASNLQRNTICWFAVVPVDRMGNVDNSVHAIAGVPIDVIAPEDVTGLNVQSYADRLVFDWKHSADTAGDLAGYRIVVDGAGPVTLPASQSSYEVTGLDTATACLLTVASVDASGNGSTGASITGVTFLVNPPLPTAVAYSGYAELAWNGSVPAEYVRHYALYVSDTDFSTVEGMTPVLTTGELSARVSGLTDQVTYYFAVTAVNLSGGELPLVTAVPATPVADALGPEVRNVRLDDVLLTDGMTVNRPCTITLDAHDPAGVSRVDFTVDGAPVRSDYSPVYSCYWDVVSAGDGDRVLGISAYDTLGNRSFIEFSLAVELAPPPAPVIRQPDSGLLTNIPEMWVSGEADRFARVLLFISGEPADVAVDADAAGRFAAGLTLKEGENRIQAAAENRSGIGPLSAAVTVTLDTTIPRPPSGLLAAPRAGGAVMLSWNAPEETSVTGYRVYRSDRLFDDTGDAVQVNSDLLAGTAFEDLPPSDGTWHYRALVEDTAGNTSALSEIITAVSDRVPPRAESINYLPLENFDPETMIMAPGRVDVVLTVSEPLQAKPFLSITPDGGFPIPVELAPASDLVYTGFFMISDSTPSGLAYAVFSARDMSGNRGTEIDAGTVVALDADGPSVRDLEIRPAAPIQNHANEPVDIQVTFGLTERVRQGSMPRLDYLLSGPEREAEPVETIGRIDTRPGDAETWQASFTLPADAGLVEPETLSFLYEGIDDLGNSSDRIFAENLFQVYQGDLPPLAVPTGLTGESLSGGRIRLEWNPVEGAAGYVLYRLAPGESNFIEYRRLDLQENLIDEPAQEGVYAYTVASIRRVDAHEAESGQSEPVQVLSDATPPDPPYDFALELLSQGIQACWKAPAYTESVTYSLYRAEALEILSVKDLTPLAAGIPQTLVIDPTPSPRQHCYTVTAVDSAGNESLPSNSFYLNFNLLPVSGMTVVQTDHSPPVLSWSHPSHSSMAGYDLYMGIGDQMTRLNSERLTELTYTDTGYTEDERIYTVVAVDHEGVESLGRSITLPVIRGALSEGEAIHRGIMNRLAYEVENPGASLIRNIRVNVGLGGYDHTSDKFSLEPGGSRVVPVVVGGYEDLADISAVATALEITPNPGETVRIVRSGEIEVGDGMLVMQLLNEEMTRGGAGTLRFALENTGEAEIEIVSARSFGKKTSGQVRVYLEDADGNVLASAPFKQSLGEMVLTLPDGTSVARVAAGETFVSEPLSINVPPTAPDNVILRLAVENIYYHHGKSDQVLMKGLKTSHAVILRDTSYFGEILSISPEASMGDENIVISGRAVERSSGDPLPGARLNLVVTVDGLERTNEVFTDAEGVFQHTFVPLSGEGGRYSVRVVHPDLTDKPVHGQFVINRVRILPTSFNLSIPVNYQQAIAVRVKPGTGTDLTNLKLVYDQADQPQAELPPGVHVIMDKPVAHLAAGTETRLPVTIWADNTAEPTACLVFKVKSDETVARSWGAVTVKARFSEAKPALFFTPDHVETGVARESVVSESIVLKNKGLEDLFDVRLLLLGEDGSPAPGWVYLNSSTEPGTIEVGGTREVSLAFAPPGDIPEGIYPFYLRVQSSNYSTTDIRLFVSVTQSGIGGALFKVSDIYTGTLNGNGELIQGLAGARVTLQNEAVLTETFNRTTDSAGEILFDNLPAGRYKFRITAGNHQEQIGRLWIKPGITATQDVFLEYNLVTVEWEVQEITIEDKYEVVLHATYETDVPAAVVVVKPASVTLPEMKPGEVLNGEFTLTNHGLIRADNFQITLPKNDRYFSYEILGGVPDKLEAMETITVPYRVTSLTSLVPENDGTGGGGGCNSYRSCLGASYDFTCANGSTQSGSASSCWTSTWGECSGGGSSSGGGSYSVVVNSGSGGSSTSSFSAAPVTVSGTQCSSPPPPEKRGCGGGSGGGDGAGGCRVEPDDEDDRCQEVGSFVNTLYREYSREDIDLTVKVQGGTISFFRKYDGLGWVFGPALIDLRFKEVDGNIVEITKDYSVFNAKGDNIWVNDEIYRITRAGESFRWENPLGEWREYDPDGRLIAYGNRVGVIGTAVYTDDADQQLVGWADRHGSQVIWIEYDEEGRISAVFDRDNRRVEYGYANDLLVSVVDVLGNETRYDYRESPVLWPELPGYSDSAAGGMRMALSGILEPGGNEKAISYDAQGGVASVTDSDGSGYRFEYSFDEYRQEYYALTRFPSGKIKETWFDSQGRTRRVSVNGRNVKRFDRDGRDLIITDEGGHVTRKSYDEFDNLPQVVHPDGSTILTEYEHTFHRPVRRVDENGVATRFVYDEAGNMIRKIEAEGTAVERITEYVYDSEGNLLTVTKKGEMDAVTTMAYDDYGNVTFETDPEGGVTRFSYDAAGNMVTRIDAMGSLWTYQYDAANHLMASIDPLGNTTRMEYDAAGNKIREIGPKGEEKTFVYDTRGNLIQTTDALGQVTRFEYSADGKLIRQIDAEGKAAAFEYDTEGRMTKTVDGNGNEIRTLYADAADQSCSTCFGAGGGLPAETVYPTFSREYAYDTRGRKTVEKDRVSPTETLFSRFEYDAAGNLVAKTDKEGNITTYTYDELRRLSGVTDPLGGVTRYAYDSRDNLLALTDAAGNTTRFEYDRGGRLTKEIRPMGQETAYRYDDLGNLVEKIDAKGQKTEYFYDPVNRLVETRYFSASDHETPVKTVTFAYDANGNLGAYDDGVTTGAYEYDAAGRKISETVDYGTFSLDYSYTYYANGQKQSFTGPDGTTYTYAYDGNNQLAAVEIPGTGSITYNEYQWNRPSVITLPGGTTKTFDYDPLMRVKSIRVKDPGQNLIMDYAYTYDLMDNVLQKSTEHVIYGYEYDELYRLIAADNPDAIGDEAFTYDSVGNRLSAAGVEGTWIYNANNELTGYGNNTFQYDSNGNTVQRDEAGQLTAYTYNVEGRLQQVEDGSGHLIGEYYYDPFGRRLWKDVAGSRTYFFYSDEGLIGEYGSVGEEIKTYGYRPNSTWTTDPLFMRVSSEYYFYHTDHLGTPQATSQ